MTELALLSRPTGGILTLNALETAGYSAPIRTQMVKAGTLLRLRNGWFALPDADPERIRAVRVGGILTCSSRLRELGLWVMPDPRLHVRVAENASRLRSPADRSVPWHGADHPDLVLHWSSAKPGRASRNSALDSVSASVSHLIRCAPRNSAIVTIDSALNTKRLGTPILTTDELSNILQDLPAKYRPLEHLVDCRSQSGLETLARIRLRALGIRVRPQVKIEGVGYVDILIGDRLVLELDSRSHHLGANYENDRRRDLELFRRGFLSLRVTYERVMHNWTSIESAILAAIRRGDHLRTQRHERLGLASL